MRLLPLIGLLALAACAGAAAESPPAGPSPAPTATLAERGATLFVNKGCITCHQNGRAEHEGQIIGVGPDLTTYSGSAAFLTEWLRNPAAVRPGTEMPTLGLSEDEIAALVAYLGAD